MVLERRFLGELGFSRHADKRKTTILVRSCKLPFVVVTVEGSYAGIDNRPVLRIQNVPGDGQATVDYEHQAGQTHFVHRHDWKRSGAAILFENETDFGIIPGNVAATPASIVMVGHRTG